jgi:hypothetical protein
MSSALSRNFPTLRYAAAPFRWFFRSRRRVRGAAAVLLATIITPPLWWSVQLLGLPDIGEPFDARAFQSFSIPDDRNAFVLYRKAVASLKAVHPSGKIGFGGRWATAEPELRRWLEGNREALDLYRQGSDRPDAFDRSSPGRLETAYGHSELISLYYLALLEASRLEERGEMAGAWTWYRAALRATYHQARYAGLRVRSFAQQWQPELRRRLTAWASDRRTTASDLRRALADLVACERLLPSDAYTLKTEYPEFERMLEGPENPGQGQPFARLNGFFNSKVIRPTPEQIQQLGLAWRWWRRESERSLRVVRLAVANWVACYELPPERRPPPYPNSTGPFPFYELGPDAPAGARAVSPAELSRWLASTIDADALLRSWRFLAGLRWVQLQDRARYRAVVVLVASELYRRDRGTDPPSDEALVGPYLKALPDDGSEPGIRPTGGTPSPLESW